MGKNSKDIKLRENNSRDSLDSARFFLSYRQSNDINKARLFSYELLSTLKGDADAVLELNSSLLLSPSVPGMDLIQDYIDMAKELGLDYRYRKTDPVGGPSFFERLFSQKRREAHEILIHIPSAVWADKSFSRYINMNGARYYFTKTSEPAGNLLDEMYKMTDRDKLNFFRMIVFENGSMGNMGINTLMLDAKDIKTLLDID